MGKLYWAGLSNLDFELVLAIQMFYTIVALVGSLIMVWSIRVSAWTSKEEEQ